MTLNLSFFGLAWSFISVEILEYKRLFCHAGHFNNLGNFPRAA
jgi:hypothetical protein